MNFFYNVIQGLSITKVKIVWEQSMPKYRMIGRNHPHVFDEYYGKVFILIIIFYH